MENQPDWFFGFDSDGIDRRQFRVTYRFDWNNDNSIGEMDVMFTVDNFVATCR
jgi:hypothetical protein